MYEYVVCTVMVFFFFFFFCKCKLDIIAVQGCKIGPRILSGLSDYMRVIGITWADISAFTISYSDRSTGWSGYITGL